MGNAKRSRESLATFFIAFRVFRRKHIVSCFKLDRTQQIKINSLYNEIRVYAKGKRALKKSELNILSNSFH